METVNKASHLAHEAVDKITHASNQAADALSVATPTTHSGRIGGRYQ